jgi:acetyl-CoA acyltransferase
MPHAISHKVKKSRRAVVVAGNRTPFVRAFGSLMKLDAIDLGVASVLGLLQRTGLKQSEIDRIVWGGVVLPPSAPNVGREIALDIGLPHSVEAYTVSRACATGLQSIVDGAAAIERGEADVVIAGGGDSTSNAVVPLPAKLIQAVAPVAMSSKSTWRDWLGVMSQLTPISEVLPRRPKIAERSTGEVMGEACERMAKRAGITREAQDAYAASSHHRAAKALADGRFDDEISPVARKYGEPVFADDLVRADTSTEKLAKLRPVFDRKEGTLTAGNSSGLTDGAGAVLLMSAERAKALGYTPLAAFRSWSFIGVDPADQLLIGPAIAMPRALERAGMELADVGIVEMHEAFAAQVLCVLKALGSPAFASERLGREGAIGQVDPAKLNPLGGSLALGHPFAATGARMVTTASNQIARGDATSALLGICAAGGLGAAAVLEAI